MQNPPLLQDYLPDMDQVPISSIVSIRQQFMNYLAQWWPQLDTRPGSIFGDLHLTPAAVLDAAAALAVTNLFSDLELTNVANGVINNPDFVRAYLKNFGVSAQAGASSTGTMAMVFSANQTYVFSGSVIFNFGSSAFQVSPTVGDPVIISPMGSTTGKYVLTPYANGQFVVYLPVTGPAGASVTDSTIANTNLGQTNLVSVTAAGNFDPGTTPSGLPQLAAQAMLLYPAANLSSRRGALSFITQNWPNLVAAAVTVTGDNEMIRAGQNPLGINQSALDIFVRSQVNYASSSVVAALTYNPDLRGWTGGLPFPSPPAFFSPSTGAFQANLFDEQTGSSLLYAQSTDTKLDNPGVSFSLKERLGVLLSDQTPTAFNNAVITPITSDNVTNAALNITGEYWGSTFQLLPDRAITMQFVAVTAINNVITVIANVYDSNNNESGTVYFVPDSAAGALTGIILQSDPGYKRFFNGLNLVVDIPGCIWTPASVVGAKFTFGFRGKTANFTLNYLYEPMLPVIDTAIQSSDNKSVNTAPLARSFVPCNITQFVVNYRYKRGTTVDAATAQKAIFNYVNSLAYPNAYEESQIGMIMLNNGATGVSSVTKTGMVYPSLAQIYVDQNQNQTAIPPVITTDLSIPSTDFGFGPRNVSYILPMAVIQFNATVY